MNTGALRLFQSSGSPNSRRVRIYLAEKGICVALVPVNLGAKGVILSRLRHNQSSPRRSDFGSRRWHRYRRSTCNRYLEEAYPERSLLGATPKEKALVTMWERRMELEGFASVMEAVRNAATGLKRPRDCRPAQLPADPRSGGPQARCAAPIFMPTLTAFGAAPLLRETASQLPTSPRSSPPAGA